MLPDEAVVLRMGFCCIVAHHGKELLCDSGCTCKSAVLCLATRWLIGCLEATAKRVQAWLSVRLLHAGVYGRGPEMYKS